MTLPRYDNYQPAHLSFSTLDGYRSCGTRFLLQKVLQVEQVPGLAGIGGNAVHSSTEEYDELYPGDEHGDFDFIASFQKHWDLQVEDRRERSPSIPVEDYVATGRAPAAYGGKRNTAWWLDHGPGMVEAWANWRKASGFSLWTTPEGRPAIEVRLTYMLPGDTPILMFIDRIMVTPAGQLVVVDIKGLATTTPLATPQGWTTMGEIGVGDEVFDNHGRVCQVTAKSEVKWLDCYRVTFDDGTSIVCDEEHLWTTTAGDAGRTDTAVRPITEIAASVARKHRVAMPDPLDLPEAELPLDPYVLGAWLGDGNRGRGVITKPDQEMFDEIVRRGHGIGVPQIDKRTGCQTRTVLGLQTTLRAMGLLGEKRIPGEYLRGSLQQRLDLLRGLMDTDGTYNQARNDVRFYSCDKALAFAVEELVLSLGERARVFEVQRKGFGKEVTSYDVVWKPQRFNPFILPRKRERVDLESCSSVRSKQRIIKKVEQIPSVATQCIGVDSPDNMYLAGHQMVPTHNTGRAPEVPEQLGLYACGIGDQWGEMFRPDWGYWWSPDKGHSSPMLLDRYTPEYFVDIAEQTSRGIEAGVFLAKPANNCKSWCGVAKHCPAVGGVLPVQK